MYKGNGGGCGKCKKGPRRCTDGKLGNVGPGERCIFPFRYKGAMINDCIGSTNQTQDPTYGAKGVGAPRSASMAKDESPGGRGPHRGGPARGAPQEPACVV